MPSRQAVSLLVALFFWSGPQAPPLPEPAAWTLGGTNPVDFVLEANGSATDPDGARISLRSVAQPAVAFGSVSSRIAAHPVRGRRVTISAELQTRGAVGGASLWLRIDRGIQQLMLDNGTGQTVRGDSEWTTRSISLPVPMEATNVVFGVLLQPGGGSVSVRRLRLDVSEPFSVDAPIAAPAKQVLDAAIKIAKAHSLHRDTLAWDTIEPKVRALAAGAESSAEVYPAVRYLLAQLGDNHSFMMPPAQTTQFKTGGAQNPAPTVQLLPERVGYVSIPGYSGGEAAAARTYATRTHESLAGIFASSSCGWVVDLRQNTGGNMWPMLAGLKPFLGNAGLGTFESPAGSSPPWIAGQAVGVEPPATLAGLESDWVAVITGPRTASSGEAVAIAFRGRPRSRSFGQPTAGLSTANGTFPLPDGAMIFLTTAVDADRTGKRYGDKVDPDERVEPVATPTMTDDPALAAAVRWLTQSSGCAKGAPAAH
jgi:carboxyl-terminal processing protease